MYASIVWDVRVFTVTNSDAAKFYCCASVRNLSIEILPANFTCLKVGSCNNKFQILMAFDVNVNL
jgi:hypothetical protein